MMQLRLKFRITESQNHRMVGVGRDLCGSPSPTPLPKQGHLQQAPQDLVQGGLEYLQRRRIHNPSGQPVPVLHHPQSPFRSRSPSSQRPFRSRFTPPKVSAWQVCPCVPSQLSHCRWWKPAWRS